MNHDAPDPRPGMHGWSEPRSEQSDARASIELLFWLGSLERDESRSVRDSRSIERADRPRELGRFRLDRLLGTGSYGAVFQAFDTHHSQSVALKVAWPAVMLDPEASRRFVEEPQTVSKISHPGIVKIHEAGHVEMAWYIAFELIEGPTLSEWVAAQSHISVPVASEIVRSVSEAIGYAHTAGIVHRDLKPSNILLRPSAGELIGLPYRPVVTDFGLARGMRARDASDATATIAYLGTDRYMSPEQASGRAREVGPASDVFSLGVILYELLTGVRPFEGDSAKEIHERIQRDNPPAIRSLRRGTPRNLETIVLKCLEKRADRRYSSAGALSEDLGRFLRGEPIQARRTSAVRRGWRFVVQRPRAIVLTTLVLATCMTVAGLLGVLISERRAANLRVLAAKEEAARAEAIEREYGYATSVRSAARSLSRGNRREVLHHLRQAETLAPDAQGPGIEWYLLDILANDFLQELPANFGSVRAVRFSPDGNVLICGGSDTRLMFWDTSTWSLQRTVFNSGGGIKCAEFSPDGSYLAVGGVAGRLVVHQMADSSIVFDQKVFAKSIYELAWLDNSTVASGGADARVAVIELDSGSVRVSDEISVSEIARRIDPVHPNEIQSMTFLAGRKQLAVLKSPVEIVFLDAETLDESERCSDSDRLGSAGSVNAIPGELDKLLVACSDRVQVLSLKDGAIVSSVPMGTLLETVRVSGELGLVAGVFRDGAIHVWSLADLLAGTTGTSYMFPSHDGRAISCDISGEGEWIASGGRDRIVRIHGTPSAGSSFETPLENRPIWMKFSACGRWLALTDRDSKNEGFVTIFGTEDGKPRWRIRQPVDEGLRGSSVPLPRWDAAFLPDGESVFVREPDGGIGRRNCASGAIESSFHADFLKDVIMVAALPNNRLILRGMPYSRVVHGESGEPSATYNDSDDVVGWFRLPEGELWVESNSSKQVMLKASHESRPFRVLGPTDERIITTTISADGQHLAMAGQSATVYLVDFQNPLQVARLMTEDVVTNLVLTSDGATLICQHQNGSVSLWRKSTRTEVLTVGGPTDRVLWMALHPNDQLLVLGVEHDGRYGLRTYSMGEDGGTQATRFTVGEGIAE